MPATTIPESKCCLQAALPTMVLQAHFQTSSSQSLVTHSPPRHLKNYPPRHVLTNYGIQASLSNKRHTAPRILIAFDDDDDELLLFIITSSIRAKPMLQPHAPRLRPETT